ncbi:uncharacterized protein BX663DRAFT_491343 [Cokeromyces recurvatus]|uniref:uncharacterized protein n=1 Tax=Cokeromyces recurvatus TaxID=90255 RepID=UPI00221F8996|nr:uncharacterized protein BX663DRAFT_491343 [Cokeromyces recurvatus]KAI7907569.1 hypothetical protein BX663DRAFT_491343 [Cokeromyces recurvatus]
MWGRLFHLTADAVLISTVLAGIKRNSGLQPATSKIENEDVRKYVEQYLRIGDWVIDSSLVYMNNSPYFERKQ